MAFNFDSLAEVTASITEPFIPRQVADIGFGLLSGTMLQNPLQGGLGSSVSNLAGISSLASGSLSPANIATAAAIASGNPLLVIAINSITPSLTNALSASNPVDNLLGHSNDMVASIPSVGSTINEMLSLPASLTGGFSSNFVTPPAGLVGLPNFGGTPTIPGIPGLGTVGIPSIPGLPNMGTLPGLSLPGVPNPTSILNGFAGSVVSPSFGGVGLPLSTGADILSGGLLSGGALGGFTGMGGLISDPLGNSSSIIGLAGDLSLGAGDLSVFGGGMDSLLGGEVGSLLGGGCNPLGGGVACGSTSSAMGQAQGLVGMAKTATTAKLVSSVATPSLNSALGFPC